MGLDKLRRGTLYLKRIYPRLNGASKPRTLTKMQRRHATLNSTRPVERNTAYHWV